MATIHGTIRGCNLLHRAEKGAGTTVRDLTELWELSVDFAAYTGSTDDADILLVTTEINARARDGKTRTLKWAGPLYSGADANNQAVDLCGASIAALAISSETLSGELCSVNTISTEVTATSGVTKGVGVAVCVSVT
jgi:hypothetical protein